MKFACRITCCSTFDANKFLSSYKERRPKKSPLNVSEGHSFVRYIIPLDVFRASLLSFLSSVHFAKSWTCSVHATSHYHLEIAHRAI